MRGGYIHNRVLVESIAQKALQLGALVDCEVSIEVGEHVLYGDLLFQYGSQRVLVEVEMSSKRIRNDLAKAAALEVNELWIVVPNPTVVKSVRRTLLQQLVSQGMSGIFIFLLPQALQRLDEFSKLNSMVKEGTEIK